MVRAVSLAGCFQPGAPLSLAAEKQLLLRHCLFDGNKYKPFGAVCQRVVSRGKGKISRVKQKETSERMSLFFCDYPQVLLFAPSHIARKGECEGKPLRVSPLAFSHPPAGDHFCTAKVPHQKRRGTQTCVSSFLVRAMGLEPTRPYGHKHLKLACLPIPARSRTRYLTIIAKPGSLSSTGGKFACCR